MFVAIPSVKYWMQQVFCSFFSGLDIAPLAEALAALGRTWEALGSITGPTTKSAGASRLPLEAIVLVVSSKVCFLAHPAFYMLGRLRRLRLWVPTTSPCLPFHVSEAFSDLWDI